MTTINQSREIRLKQMPTGMPKPTDFEVATVDVPAPQDGEVLVRNIWMSVDPYMRGRMTTRKSYAEGYKVGKVLEGHAVGQVVASRSPGFKAGDYVTSMFGWREAYVSPAAANTKIDPSLAPIEAYLGVLGMPGLTAYAAMTRVVPLKGGERMFVSGAAGAVGSIVCQIGKLKGCYVVGSAGTKEKCDWLTGELGVDRAINYKETDNLAGTVAGHFPEGIDVYFENVGGAHLEAALSNMKVHGRIALCGLIDQYNSFDTAVGPRNIAEVIIRRLEIKGLLVFDHADLIGDFFRDFGGWIKGGKIKWKETVFEGLEKAPDAFIGLFTGANTGKMLVRIGPDPAI